MDPAVREPLNVDLKSVLSNEAVKTKLTNMGMVVLMSPSDEFGKFIDSEITKWGQVIKAGASPPNQSGLYLRFIRGAHTPAPDINPP